MKEKVLDHLLSRGVKLAKHYSKSGCRLWWYQEDMSEELKKRLKDYETQDRQRDN